MYFPENKKIIPQITTIGCLNTQNTAIKNTDLTLKEGNMNKSSNTTAEGDAVPQGELSDLNPKISNHCLVECQHVILAASNFLRQRSIRRRHHRSVPQRVIISDRPPNPNQLHQPFVIVDIVVLVSIHKYEIECPLIFLLITFN